MRDKEEPGSFFCRISKPGDWIMPFLSDVLYANVALVRVVTRNLENYPDVKESGGLPERQVPVQIFEAVLFVFCIWRLVGV